MALTRIEYGTVASSEVVNDNFQYLEEQIDSVAQTLSANVTTINNGLSQLSATVASNKSLAEKAVSELNAEVEEKLDKLDARIHIVEGYRLGKNWYRLYSDGWIEQGGYVALSGTNAAVTVSLLKNMADSNYSVIVSGIKATTSSNQDGGAVAAVPISSSQIKITAGRDAAGGATYWHVCGFVG